MDNRLDPIKNKRAKYFRRWLANIIAVFGVLLTIFLCFFLPSHKIPLILTIGISISLLAGMMARGAYQSRRKQTKA
jgi:hypothetical protein